MPKGKNKKAGSNLGRSIIRQQFAPTMSADDRQLLSLEVASRNVSGSLPAVGGQGTDAQRRSYRHTAAAGGAALVQVALACLSADGRALARRLVEKNGREGVGLACAPQSAAPAARKPAAALQLA